MKESYTGKRRVRRTFGRIDAVSDMPSLIEVQTGSYADFIENKNYILFPNDNSLYEIKIQKHNGSPSQFPAENPNSKNKVENKPSQELMKKRIKNLIQFFKEEKDIFTLFEQNINKNNENDMKDYYLINKNWIRFYEEKNNYKKISPKNIKLSKFFIIIIRYQELYNKKNYDLFEQRKFQYISYLDLKYHFFSFHF